MEEKLTSEELHGVEAKAKSILVNPATSGGLRAKAKGFLTACAKLRAALIVEEAEAEVRALKQEAEAPVEPPAEPKKKGKKKGKKRRPEPEPEPLPSASSWDLQSEAQ